MGAHRVKCPYCLITFAGKVNLKNHIKQKHAICPSPEDFCCEKTQVKLHFKDTPIDQDARVSGTDDDEPEIAGTKREITILLFDYDGF